MAKGPSGNTTTTTHNVTQDAQLPYIQEGWQHAQDLLHNNQLSYYPDTTMQAANPWQWQGLQNMLSQGGADQNMINRAGSTFDYGASGGMSSANNPAMQALAAQAYGIGPGQLPLEGMANGQYLNSNPYLGGMFNAASDAVTRAYQTATAPQTDSAYENAGRYQSGGLENARSQNEQNLGKTLGNLAQNIYGTDYQNERGLQTQAATALGGLAGQGAQNLSGAYNSGNQMTLQALGMEPYLLGAANTGNQTIMQGATGVQQLGQQAINDAMARFYGNQQAPYQSLSQYMNLIGEPVLGGGSITQPYFSPSIGNTLGGLGGLAGGIGQLFGGGGGAAAAGTVICTELMRQGRMPKRWWIASGREAARWYPAVVRRGYEVWAIPSVRHLRCRPDSFYSRALCRAFNWHAEATAITVSIRRQNVPIVALSVSIGRWLRGRVVTAALAVPCLVFGLIATPEKTSTLYEGERT